MKLFEFLPIRLQTFAEVPAHFETHVNRTTDTAATTGNDLSVEMKTFYDMTLIDMAGPLLVHDQFGQKRPIPRNGGKVIEFRKFYPLAKAMTPLVEGVTPPGDVLDATNILAEVHQYGNYIVQSDILELTAIDNTILEATKLLAKQAGRTLDTVTRNALHATTNHSWCSTWSGTTETIVEKTEDMDETSVLSVDMIMRQVAKLRACDAPTINGKYVAIIHPYAAYDLMRDPEWQRPHEYQDTTNLYEGEIGEIAGVRFVQTSEALITAPEFIAGSFNKLTVKTNASASTTVVVKEAVPTATFSDGLKVYVDGVEKTLSSITYNAGGSTLTFSEALTVSADKVICGEGGTKKGLAVFNTLIIGEGAYGVTEVTGGGLQTIVKQKGAGEDPLNQRSSVGWKAIKTAEVLIDDYLIDLESVSPKFSANAQSN